ncbi:MAG TPA: ATP synthase subunit I [Alphaproteobacteria bacterium]
MSATAPLDLVLGVVAGAAAGTLHFGLLWRAVRLHAQSAAASRIVPLHLVRAGATVAVFWLVAQRGALPLLLALAGFLVARVVVQHRLRAE